MTQRVLSEIKKKLPRGFIPVLAKRATVSERTVIRFFNGKNHNGKVKTALAEYLKELKSQDETIQQAAV